MTSLFFVMLVLFILTVGVLVRQVRATQSQLEKIREIEEAIKELPEDFFAYNDDLKKHIFTVDVEFETGKSDFNFERIRPKHSKIIDAGLAIDNLLKKFSKKDDINVQYLVIIEGQSSRRPFIRPNECDNNDVLSYQRALALKKFWEENNIDLETNPNCELIIAGSGKGGVPREPPDDIECTRNQRFLIHIIPKPGVID